MFKSLNVKLFEVMALGELKSKIRRVIHDYLLNELTDEEFKNNIEEIIDKFKGRMPEWLLCQDIALITRERENKNPNKIDRFKKIWALLDQISPKIKKALNHWNETMME